MSIRAFESGRMNCRHCLKEKNELVPLTLKKEMKGITFRMKKI